MCSTMEVGIFVRFKLHTFEPFTQGHCGGKPRCAKAVVMLSSGPCEAYKAAYIIGMISVLANFPGESTLRKGHTCQR